MKRVYIYLIKVSSKYLNKKIGNTVLQCSDQMADRVSSAVMKYIWMGKVEKPQRSVVYRPINQGGLGMIHIPLFYRSLFLCPIYKVLPGPESPESSLLRFWMSFPLRTSLPNIYHHNSRPFAVMERPAYLKEPMHLIKSLLSSSILVHGKPMVHRSNYRHWIQEVCGPGKIEILRPTLDWKFIWMETAALPHNIREIMFLFNQRLLPTRTRCHLLDSNADPNCPLCHQDPETDEHLMINCHLRHQLWSWLEGTIRKFGCRTSPNEIIRGHIGKTENPRKIFTLVAAYIFTTWKERTHHRIPREAEVKNLWASIYPNLIEN
jgi:hypothetical protein